MKKLIAVQYVLLVIMKVSLRQMLIMALLTSVVYSADLKGQEILERKITLNLNNREIKFILSRIEKQSSVRFTYNAKSIMADKRVSIHVNERKLESVLKEILGARVTYELVGSEIVLSEMVTEEAAGEEFTPDEQAIQVQGKVTDENGQPVPGVNIVEKGTVNGTATDSNGKYSLMVQSNDAVLVFSFIGYETREVTVGQQTIIDISLSADIQTLSEVVVVGYGETKKSDLTGAVASVPVEDIKKMPLTSIDQSLQGRAAGVQITQNSASPGGTTTIRIRGGNSIKGDNEPLYVIDGVPFKNDGASSGSSFNVLSTLNPGDIESMTVLKDASSTAIYGSRGSNGVVIITTRRGKSGRPMLSVESYYGVQTVRRKYPVMNASEYAQLVNDANTNEGKAAVYTADQVAAFGKGTDWQDEILRSAPISNFQLSMSGGDDKTQYAMSGGYFKQEGIVVNSGFERASFRLNLDKKINDRLKLGNSLTISRTVNNQSRTDGSLGSAGLVTIAALQYPPILPVRNSDGSYLITDPALNFTADNPVALANDNKNLTTAFRVFGNVFGEYEIIKGLTFKALLGVDAVLQKQDSYLPRSVQSGLAQGGVAYIGNSQAITWLNENLLTYNHDFNQIHNLNVLVGYTQQANRTESSSSSSRNFVNDDLGVSNLGAGSVPLTPSSSVGAWGLKSYLLRVNYTLKSKYLFTISSRADGSSRFGSNKRYGYFPSAAVAWKIKEELFMSNVSSIDDLKVRASYGLTGNQDGIGDYPSYSLLSTQNYVLGNTLSTGIGPSQVANPDLSWETTAQADVGVDVVFLDSRISVTTDVYLKRTRDLLLDVVIPSSSGYSSAIKNLGQVENKGIEFSVSTRNIVKAFTWNTDLNFSINQNKVVDIGGVSQIFAGQVANIAQNVNSGIIRVGEPLGSFYGYVTDGIYQTTEELSAVTDPNASKVGDRRYRDNHPDGKIDDLDRTIIGRAQPKFIGGITNNFSYKGFDLTIFIQGVYGNDILNANRFELEYLNGTTNQSRDMLDRWTPTHTDTDIPRASTTRPANRISTRQIEDGSYVRLKNIQLAYNLPSSLLKSVRLQSFRVYVTAQNLWTLTNYSGYDPEVSRYGQDSRSQGFDYSSYPAAKTIMAGVNIGF